MTIPPDSQWYAIKRIIEDAHKRTPRTVARGREPLVNAIEACHRAAAWYAEAKPKRTYKPEVYVGPHPSYPNLLCYADNGDGLNNEDVTGHLATIACSGNIREIGDQRVGSFDTNKGTGVKAANLPDNKAGLDYVSIKQGGDGVPSWFRLAYLTDPKTGQHFPGLKQLNREDGWEGQPTLFLPVTNEADRDNLLPFDHIKRAGHGTVLTLFGSDPGGLESTMDGNEVFKVSNPEHGSTGTAATGLWRWINCRFWELSDVKVTVNCGGNTGPQRAQGCSRYLDAMQVKGTCTVHLPDGTPVALHWYISEPAQGKGKDRGPRLKSGANWEDKGHFGLKFKNEVYRQIFAGSRHNAKILTSFGIAVGQGRVCLYVDLDSLPKSAQGNVCTNDIRTELYYGDLRLDHQTFNEEFIELLSADDPSVQELNHYLRDNTVFRRDAQESRERLRKLLKEMNAKLLTTSVDTSKPGSHKAADEAPNVTTGGKPVGNPDTSEEGPPAPQPVRRVRPQGSQQQGVETWHQALPDIVWNADDEAPETAATYTGRGFIFYRNWKGYSDTVNELVAHTVRNSPTFNHETMAELARDIVEQKAEELVVLYVAQIGDDCRRNGESFELIRTRRCSDEVLTARTVSTRCDFNDMRLALVRSISAYREVAA